MIGLDVVTVVIGMTNKKIGLLGVPGSLWVVSGVIGLGIGAVQAFTCPPIPNTPQRKFCYDRYGRSYFC